MHYKAICVIISMMEVGIMKLNPKIYSTLNEPFEVQDLNGVRCELHSMNETPYLTQYTSKGRFAVWSSTGQDYKLLIEKGYYDVMRDLYDKKINQIWLEFYQEVDRLKRQSTFRVFIPLMAIYILVLTILSQFLQDNTSVLFLVLLVLTLFVSILNNKILTKRVKAKNRESVEKIKKIKGEKKFEKLLEDQKVYIDDYLNTMFASEDDKEKDEDQK